MKLCFNQATTMAHSTLEQDLELCEKHGYDLIEIKLDKLRDYLKQNTLEDLANFFTNSKIKPFAFNALEFISFRDEKGHKEILDNLQFLCEVSDVIDCKKIVVVPTFDVGSKTVGEIKAETVRSLNELADIAEKHNIKLAFEFVGYPNCSVNRFEEAYAIVKEVNRESVGVVLDCFHFYAMGSSFECLEKADGDKIFIFHIDDSEDLPIGALRDDKRVWPGDGVIDLKRIIKILKEKNVLHMASIELFRPEYWEWETELIIKTGKEKTLKVIESVL